VFYYLLAGAGAELRASLHLGEPTDYFYLGHVSVTQLVCDMILCVNNCIL